MRLRSFSNGARRVVTSITTMAVTATMLPVVALTVGAEPADAAPTTFAFTGSEQTWTVPTGVTQIGVDAWGAQGGAPNLSTNGAGGRTRGIVNVTPGETVYVYVGGKGQYANGCGSIFGCDAFDGGWNGGGFTDPYLGGAGGGGTDLRIGDNDLDDRVIVAGGGGGTAAVYGGTQAAGGIGGGITGGNGANTSKFTGGGGGTQTAGGPPNGFGGAGGFGGGGFSNSGSGAGGGGWYGGAGGAGDYAQQQPAGGGGGSGHVASGVTETTMESGVAFGNGILAIYTDLSEFRSLPQPPSSGPAGGPILANELYGGINLSLNYLPCSTGKPVECSTGNFWHTFNDLSIPGRGVAMNLSRTYNSLEASSDSLFGHGWSSTYDMSLAHDSITGKAVISQENGSQVTFTDNGSGSFTAPPRVLASLVHNGDGTWTFKRKKRETFTFDSSGKLMAQTDLNGYVTAITYPSSSAMVVTDPAGRTLTFTISSGHVTEVTDPAGRTLSYDYDDGDLVEVTDVGGGHATFTYDDDHRMLTMRSPRFHNDNSTSPSPVITNHYDSAGRVDWQTDELGRQTTFAYNVNTANNTSTTTITDPKGNVEVQQYAYGQLTSLTKGSGTPQAATWTYAYDQNVAAISSVTDPNGHQTSSTYDASGNVTSVTDGLNHTTTATYNNFNQPLTATNANNITTTYTYDANGNLLTQSRPLVNGATTENEVTTYTYGDVTKPGDVTQITDPKGKSTAFTYNAYGDVTSTTNPMGEKTTMVYNTPTSIGWLMSSVAPKGNAPGAIASQFTTTFTRNNYGQVLTAKDPLWTSGNPTAHIVTNVYDADGNLTSTTDGSNNTTTMTFDPAGQVTKVTRPDLTTLQSSYYPDGTLQTQTDGRGKVTTYTYDPLRHLASIKDPLNRTTSFVVDPVGNLTKKIEPGGLCTGTVSGCTSFSYDAANRQTGITYSDGVTPNVTYGYDNIDRRTSMIDGTGTSTYTYDTLNRLTSHTRGGGQTVGYAYDRNDNLIKITYPGNLDVTRTYDDANRFISLTDWLGKTTRFTYDPNSNQTSTIYGNGLASVNTFDRADQLMGINVGKGAKATFNYTRNGNGSLTGTTATGIAPATESFAYDVNNRLTSYNANPLTYDNSDNLTTMADGSTLAYDDASQIISKTVAGIPTTYGYNTRGDRISAGATTYAFDQASRLTNYNNGVGTYAHDGDGLRTSKTVGGNTSQFVYNIVEGLPQVLSDGTNHFVHGPGGVPVEQINGSTVTYLHQDQLGSTRALTDASRNVVGTYSYDPYGKTTAHTGASTPLQYAGQYTDAESGLVWMRARHYDPNTGSFLTVDPLRDITRAPYNYANNQPTNVTDPSGQIAPLVVGLGVLAWGVVEVGLSVSDAYSTGQTLADPCASGFEKGLSVGLFGLGVVGPGGGYSTGAKAVKNSWGRTDTLEDHFARHGSDFGSMSKEHYANQASEFLQNGLAGGASVKINPKDGSIRVYDPQTNTFGAYNTDGTTLTFFKPDKGSVYWQSQPGVAPWTP